MARNRQARLLPNHLDHDHPRRGRLMALADLIAQQTYRAAPGRLERVLDSLTPNDRAGFITALHNPAVPPSANGRALRALGHDIGDERIRIARPEGLQ